MNLIRSCQGMYGRDDDYTIRDDNLIDLWLVKTGDSHEVMKSM